MPPHPRLRCFVALNLPEPVCAEALRVQDQLRQLNVIQGRFTALENIHLTLKFLGEITPDQVTDVAMRLQTIAMPSFAVKLGRAGQFSPRIIWLQLIGSDTLQQQVDKALTPLFPPEARFMGHITIARVKKTRQPRVLAEALQALTPSPNASYATSFSLRQSILNPEGPKYEPLHHFPLAIPSTQPDIPPATQSAPLPPIPHPDSPPSDAPPP
tara:strand:+ start:132 stop:770 length:639 start_codon:yes stop_codon:yes gene_type:complete